MPDGWTQEQGCLRCLQCRRDRALEAAVVDGMSKGERRRAMQFAIVKFELLRDPHRPNGEIGKPAKASATHVREVRAELIAARVIERGGRMRSPAAAKKPKP